MQVKRTTAMFFHGQGSSHAASIGLPITCMCPKDLHCIPTAHSSPFCNCHYHNLCAQALDDHCWSAALGVVFGGVVAGSCVVAATLVVAGSCVVAAILVVAGRAVVPGCCVLATGKFVVC